MWQEAQPARCAVAVGREPIAKPRFDPLPHRKRRGRRLEGVGDAFESCGIEAKTRRRCRIPIRQRRQIGESSSARCLLPVCREQRIESERVNRGLDLRTVMTQGVDAMLARVGYARAVLEQALSSGRIGPQRLARCEPEER